MLLWSMNLSGVGAVWFPCIETRVTARSTCNLTSHHPDLAWIETANGSGLNFFTPSSFDWGAHIYTMYRNAALKLKSHLPTYQTRLLATPSSDSTKPSFSAVLQDGPSLEDFIAGNPLPERVILGSREQTICYCYNHVNGRYLYERLSVLLGQDLASAATS